MKESMPTPSGRPRFYATESGRLVSNEYLTKLKDRAMSLTAGTILHSLKQSIDSVAEFRDENPDLEKMRLAISKKLREDRLMVNSGGSILEELQNFRRRADLICKTYKREDIRMKIADDLQELVDLLASKIDLLEKQKMESRHKPTPLVEVAQEAAWSDTAAVDEIRQKIDTHDKPNKTEKETLREKIIQAVMRDAGVLAHTSLEKDISPTGRSGYQNTASRYDERQRPGSPLSVIKNRRGDSELQQHDIDESICFTVNQVPILESVTIPAVRSLFGGIKTPERTEYRDTGKVRILQHSEAVKDGKPEPLVNLDYSVRPDPYKKMWRDYSGRAGQLLELRLALPKSTALELQAVLIHDPTFIREIVERVMTEKVLGPEKAHAWNKPTRPNSDSLKPPYERLSPHIYLQPLDESGKPPEYHEEYNHEI